MFRLFAFVAVLLLAMQSIASADQPLREVRHFDNDVKLIGASRVCGFEIRGHFVGESIFTLFYDKAGNIIKEMQNEETPHGSHARHHDRARLCSGCNRRLTERSLQA